MTTHSLIVFRSHARHNGEIDRGPDVVSVHVFPPLEIQRGKQTIACEIPVSEKQDVQERLADLVTREQAKIPQLGILALTLDDQLVPMLPPLPNRFGVVVAGKESYGAYQGDGPFPGDVIYSVNGMPVDGIDSLRSALDDPKTADAIALQVERLGSLHYLVVETDKRAKSHISPNWVRNSSCSIAF